MLRRSERDEFLALAADCRKLARMTHDETVRRELLEIAERLEGAASGLAQPPATRPASPPN